MRLTLLLVLGLAVLTPSSHAIRSSASSKLAKLSQRLAVAESALAQLKSSSELKAAPGPQPMSQYTFDYSNYADSISILNQGTVIPSGASNIGFIFDNSRSSQVLVRNPSKTYATSILSLPNQLTSSFTLLLWANWAGVVSGTEQHVIDSSDSSLQIYLDGNGYYNAIVNGVPLVDTSAVVPSLTWHFLAVVVDSSASTFTFFSGNAQTNTKVGTVKATYPAKATTLSLFNYGISPTSTKSWAGEIDSVSVFTYALSDSDLNDVWWGTNNGAAPTGQAPTAPGPYAFYGHFSQAQVTFADRFAGAAAGDVYITIQVEDIDVDVGDEIRLRFYGCGGTATSGYVKLPDDGTLASYNNLNGVVSLKPQQTIKQGAVYTFHLPASLIQITNPTTIYASASDPNWKIGIVFTSQQIPQTGCHYLGLLITPATLNPNPTL